MSNYLYIGQRMVSGKSKLHHAFVEQFPTDEGVVTRREFTYWPNAKTSRFYGCQIGKIYRIDAALPEIWSAVVVGEADEETRLRLQVETKHETLRKNDTKLVVDPELQDLIVKLRVARDRIPYGKRLNFAVWLLRELDR